MKYMTCLLLAAVMPLAASAQQDAVTRLNEVLPADLATRVVAQVEHAREMGLPVQAVANLALEGVAKGRSADEVLAAVELLVVDMGRAREALASDDRPVAPGEIEAATTALRMGVDGSDVAELARSGPPGRSLAIPLLVMGGLAQRGLPSDQALQAVSERLAARVGDAELLGTFGAPGLGGQNPGVGPGGANPGAGGGRGAGAGGADVPTGPPDGAGRPPAGRGRGNANANGPPGA
ncbi:MAG: hypothetical protein PVJ80_04510 [Gemmatimonadota bacterium]|jgi:hypothetical protein